ncbi:hypothetical protein WN867_11315, partial [Tetragenococcus halophilus]|uniref:hypothetical protein n=1 Tax=Tetragenococcus halophilus TaxID=51669 RepID=UPI0030C9B46C
MLNYAIKVKQAPSIELERLVFGSIIFSVVTEKISDSTIFFYNKKAFVSFIIKLDTKPKEETNASL